MIEHLFVYGTLAPGKRNAHIMNGIDGIWQKASVRGHIFKSKSGIHSGLPGFTPDPKGPVVTGLIFSSHDLHKHWPRLDAFETGDYQRVPIQARLETGEILIVQIYERVAGI